MGFFRDLTGRTAVDAAKKGADAQVQGSIEASQLLDPFKSIGEQGLSQAGFLTDPNAQYEFLQNNPLFQMSLDNANENTMGLAAARGRLSSGDTLQQLSNNAMLTAMPFISDQKQSIGDLLNYGLTTASNQGNLRTGQAAAEAGGIVGAANARGARAQNVFDLGMGVASNPLVQSGIKAFFSDPKLKTNIKKVGAKNGFNIYTWTWNKAANALGLSGNSEGVMADEVALAMPEAIGTRDGYMTVNYDMVGV